MHMIDALVHGGAERAAISIANLLPRDRYTSHLCTTRDDGAQAGLVAGHVARLRLSRQHRFDVRALKRLMTYIRRNEIDIIHAHTSSLFLAQIAALLSPYPAVVWHVHYGRDAEEDRPARMYRLAARNAKAVIAVSEPLVKWLSRRLHIEEQRLWYLPNFVGHVKPGPNEVDLPGSEGFRIVNIANFRKEKDQINLVRAMAVVHKQEPRAHLILVGAPNDRDYLATIEAEIAQHELQDCISILGARTDVAEILQKCDIGVLSSVTEGLPIVLLEYGQAGLPVVATDVGECSVVLDHGRSGKLVPPSAPKDLAEAILGLLKSAEERSSLGIRFRLRTEQNYGAEQGIHKICQIYDEAMRSRRTPNVMSPRWAQI